MDDYSDMNFAAWRNKAHGWKLWVHPAYIRDRPAFDKAFEPVGQLSFSESLDAQIRLIEWYRQQLGPIPVLYLHQPVAYYRKLELRAEFRRLGPELERVLPNVYAGDVDDEELEPDDMGKPLRTRPDAPLHRVDLSQDDPGRYRKRTGQWLPPRQTMTPS